MLPPNQAQISQPNFYAIIPANVRYCKNLEPSAKLLYGEITALAQREGFCWAKDEYFADLYEVDERTIKRWILSLKKEKFITIEHIQVHGFIRDRKIWISPEIKRISTKDKNVPGARDKNVPYINTTSITKEKRERGGASPPAPPTRSFFYKRLKLEMGKYNKLCDEFTTNVVQRMMDRLDEYADINPQRFKKYGCHAAVIRKWIREDNEKKPKGRSEMAQETIEKLKRYVGTTKDARIELYSKHVEFPGYGSGSFADCISYDDPRFAEKVARHLEKMRIKL